MFLTDPKISYLVLTSENYLTSYLYSRNYNVVDVSTYYQEQFEKSVIAVSGVDNLELRRDVLHIMENSNRESIIVKYKGDDFVYKIYEDGSKKLLKVDMYNNDPNIPSFVINEVSFSFIPDQEYIKPKSESDFKVGMIIECLSGNKWLKREVVDPHSEYDKMYKLLIKYDKVRIPSSWSS